MGHQEFRPEGAFHARAQQSADRPRRHHDALSAIVAAINLPAGAAPPDPYPIPVPPAALLLLTGAGALTAMRRKKKAQ
ncbi:MAG: VPLPA-CTERM sorting domain-containing protein [Parvularculaceae bacterium]